MMTNCITHTHILHASRAGRSKNSFFERGKNRLSQNEERIKKGRVGDYELSQLVDRHLVVHTHTHTHTSHTSHLYSITHTVTVYTLVIIS